VVAEVEAPINPYSGFRYWDVLLRAYWPVAVLRYICRLFGHGLRFEEDKSLYVELGHQIIKGTVRIRLHEPMKCTEYSKLIPCAGTVHLSGVPCITYQLRALLFDLMEWE